MPVEAGVLRMPLELAKNDDINKPCQKVSVNSTHEKSKILWSHIDYKLENKEIPTAIQSYIHMTPCLTAKEQKENKLLRNQYRLS